MLEYFDIVSNTMHGIGTRLWILGGQLQLRYYGSSMGIVQLSMQLQGSLPAAAVPLKNIVGTDAMPCAGDAMRCGAT